MNVLALVDEEVAGHLALALARHLRRCRDDGLEVPDAVRQLADATLAVARGRQEATNVDVLAELTDGGPAMGSYLLDYETAARLLGVSRRTVERLVASGDLVAVTVGDGSPRIRRSDLEAYVDGLDRRPFAARVEHKQPAAAGGRRRSKETSR